MTHSTVNRDHDGLAAAAGRPAQSRPPGFALVVTVTLMLLLSVLIVGLLGLSSATLRASSQQRHAAEARANARLALMLALGELQTQLGPDQRISAPSAILEDPTTPQSSLKHPALTGVWRSRDDALGTRPDYDRETPFLGWLVSNPAPEGSKKLNFASLGSFENPATLVSERKREGTGNAIAAVTAGRIKLPSTTVTGSGSAAWWIGDENCKGFTAPDDSHANIPQPDINDILDATATPGGAGMLAVDNAFPVNTPQASMALSHGSLGLIASQGPQAAARWFHDLSPHAKSILCNVSKGGLRHDLSLFLENPAFDTTPWPGSGANASPAGPNRKIALSPADEYDVLSWKSLYHYYHMKRKVAITAGRPTLTTYSGSGSTSDEFQNPRWNAGMMRPGPVPVRCLMFVSFGTVPDPANPSRLLVRFYTYPVLSLWNPYNVDLVVPEFNIFFHSMPMDHDMLVNGQSRGNFTWRTGAGQGVRMILDKELRLAAGEAKLMSPVRWDWSGSHQFAHYLDAVPFNLNPRFVGGEWGKGPAAGGGNEQTITVSGSATDRLEIRSKVTLFENGGSAYGNTDYQATFDMRGNHAKRSDGNWGLFLRSSKLSWRYERNSPSPSKLPVNNLPGASFGELRNAPRPFMVVDIQLKALDESEYPNKTWSHTIPGHAFLGATREGGPSPAFASGYKLSFEPLNSFQEASSHLQVAPDNPTRTYFGGSQFPQLGQSLVTDIEIPMAPLTSLAQLQHLHQASIDGVYSSGFHLQNHAIGNSFASPGVPADAVRSPSGWPFWVDMYINTHGGTISGQKFNQGTFHTRPNIDRSYAANHLLWDQYFFSSMAAKDSLMRPAGSRSTVDRVVREFLTNGKPLANERYKPYLSRPATRAVTELVARGSPTPTGHLKAAGVLMVEGGFNVNSTSLEAWKTVIASTHRRRVAILDTTGGRPRTTDPGNFIVSRFTLPNAGSADAAAGRSREALRWLGYRELTEAQIESLAEAIVRQVKLRGPFRSLGEFVNRRLAGENDERSLSGALQAALDDPASGINNDYLSDRITAEDIASAAFQNRSAALGSRYQGSPATITQADLLGPIAPVLNARSDTFVVRGYGESLDASGRVTARAWCEAVVQRLPDYFDPADLPEVTTLGLKSDLNKRFGRQMKMISFRWLSPDEV